MRYLLQGDCAKLREALQKCANWGEQIDCQLGSSDATVYAFRNERCLAHNISECARAALAAPPRNCGMPKEAEIHNSGNATKLREALEAARDLLLPQCNGGTAFAKACGETVNKIMDALSAPPRNCDKVKTSWEVLKEWHEGLDTANDIVRLLDWLLAPAKEKEGGTK